MGKKERERNIDDYIRKPHFFKDYSPEDVEKFKKMIYDYSQKTIDSLEQFK